MGTCDTCGICTAITLSFILVASCKTQKTGAELRILAEEQVVAKNKKGLVVGVVAVLVKRELLVSGNFLPHNFRGRALGLQTAKEEVEDK